MTENQKIVELAKAYKNFGFRNQPPKEVLKELKADVPANLKEATNFIVQAISANNQLLTKPYLSRPSVSVLRQLYIIRAVRRNIGDENQIDNKRLVDSLSKMEVPIYELVDNYYGMVFSSVSSKNQPFDLSKLDIKMKDYNFGDDTERGIMFLRFMEYCGKVIWGYMNIVKPPNTSKAMDHIKKFPKFNGQPYYQYVDLYFADFDMQIIDGEGVRSYKSYYINKFYETLLNHFLCLIKEGASEEEKTDLLLGSILKERNLYKYTNYRPALEEIFQVHEVD